MKSKIYYVLIISFLVFVSFYYGGLIKKNVMSISNYAIYSIYNFKNYLSNEIQEHFNQAREIEYLREKNKELEKNSILASTFANELNRLLEDKNSSKYIPRISLARAVSYVQINDYKKIWLDLQGYLGNKSRGLIYNGYSAGILINKDNRPMGLLQGDDKCVFSVYIGKDKIPAILQGENGKTIINFIPKWANIKIGDEVLTSGLDDIFFSGIPVGKIESIIDKDMYQLAHIKTYANINIPSYFYVVDDI